MSDLTRCLETLQLVEQEALKQNPYTYIYIYMYICYVRYIYLYMLCVLYIFIYAICVIYIYICYVGYIYLYIMCVCYNILYACVMYLHTSLKYMREEEYRIDLRNYSCVCNIYRRIYKRDVW